MNSGAAPTARKTVKIDKETDRKLKEAASLFNKLFTQEQQTFQTSTVSTYYIVSTVYLKQWQQFCSSHQHQRQLPIPMNEDIIINRSNKLKEGLVENVHFQIVSEKIFDLIKLQNQPAQVLKRKSYYAGNQKKVPINLIPYSYLLLTPSHLKSIDYKRMTPADLIKKQASLSSESSLQNFIDQIKEDNKMTGCRVRVWKCPKDISIEQIHRHIRLKCSPINTPYVIPGIGKMIEYDPNNKDQPQIKMETLVLQQDQFFIIEAIDETKRQKWFFRSPDEERCETCYQYGKLKFHCGCKKVSYCSEECQEKDKRYHTNRCPYAQEEELNKKIQMKMTKESKKGLVGLSNLGNTCFMNSCLQCLSHTLPLTHYFLNSYYESQINKENVLGTKGKLAKTYAKFIKTMWCNSQNSCSPYSLKSAVASINPMFSGFAQHDSQEFFSFLADGLHEDLSRVPKKPYVESVESNGRKDEIVARQSWIAHTKRNQSIITDLMTGQYKSKVVCPDCKKQSITFDPFTTVSLPVSENQSGYLKFFYIFCNNEHKAHRYSLNYKKADPQIWFHEIAKIIKKKPTDFSLYILTKYQDIYNCMQTPKNEFVSKIQEGKLLFALELSPYERQAKNPMTIVVRLCKPDYYNEQYDNLWFKRPFVFDRNQDFTGRIIYRNILSFVFQIYEKKKTSFFGGSMNQQQYIQKMTQDKHFSLVLKYKKKVSRMYSRVQTKFEKQVKIEEDTFLPNILDKLNQNDYELDVRFSKDKVKDYNFDRMTDHNDYTEKQSKKGKQAITTSLEQCLNDFEAKEILEPGNQWYCSQCKQHKLATKEMYIYKAPQILILHLKRFKNKGVWRKEKNQTDVLFPELLDMSKYVIDQKAMGTYRQILKKQAHYHEPAYKVEESHSPPVYELYGITNHYGGLGGGHYTAYCKNNGQWYQFDDSRVHGISESKIKGSSAYILFYQRKNGMSIK